MLIIATSSLYTFKNVDFIPPYPYPMNQYSPPIPFVDWVDKAFAKIPLAFIQSNYSQVCFSQKNESLWKFRYSLNNLISEEIACNL